MKEKVYLKKILLVIKEKKSKERKKKLGKISLLS